VLSSKASPKRVGTDVEKLIVERFDLDIKVVVRTRAQLEAVVKRNPFEKVAKNPKLYQVTFLAKAPPAEVMRKLEAAAAGRSGSRTSAASSTPGTPTASAGRSWRRS
jgi:uncharacterized protein (DUF1697 family)